MNFFFSFLRRKKKPTPNFRSHFAVPESGINFASARGRLRAEAGVVGVTEMLVTTAALQGCDRNGKSSHLPANLLVCLSHFPRCPHLQTVPPRMLSLALPPSRALLTQWVSRSSSPRQRCFEEGCLSRGPKVAPRSLLPFSCDPAARAPAESQAAASGEPQIGSCSFRWVISERFYLLLEDIFRRR